MPSRTVCAALRKKAEAERGKKGQKTPVETFLKQVVAGSGVNKPHHTNAKNKR